MDGKLYYYIIYIILLYNIILYDNLKQTKKEYEASTPFIILTGAQDLTTSDPLRVCRSLSITQHSISY